MIFLNAVISLKEDHFHMSHKNVCNFSFMDKISPLLVFYFACVYQKTAIIKTEKLKKTYYKNRLYI
jgi:hypothetical protein